MPKREWSAPLATARRPQGKFCPALAALTDLGRIRQNNEDSFLVYDLRRRAPFPPEDKAQPSFARPGLLLAVADGMGGHSSGQVASRLCVDNLPLALLELLPEGDAPAEECGEALRRAVEVTNEAIFNTARHSDELKGMGTTLTVAWLLERQALVAQVGDSRAYLYRENTLTQLTHDQTVLNALSEEERAALVNTPFENMLLQAVGAMERLEVVVSRTDLAPGDSLLLCSDGLFKAVSAEQMVEILKKASSPQEKVKGLVAAANAAGGPDNVTTVLCQLVPAREGPAEQDAADGKPVDS